MSVRSGSLMAVLLVASALTGCEKRNVDDAWESDEPVRYCVDAAGHRVPDEHCNSADGRVGRAFLWYYLGTINNSRRYYVPPLGAAASGGSFAPEPGVSYSSVTRGGFGGTAAGHGEGVGE
ncbi:MAG TPA: hypothetical protein VKQ54_09210 [Caulobacteraceae bacterium]|nr:hypothetical protein [Caulobacteraceae bacterium]